MSIKSLISSIMVLLLITLLNFGCTKKEAIASSSESTTEKIVMGNQSVYKWIAVKQARIAMEELDVNSGRRGDHFSDFQSNNPVVATANYFETYSDGTKTTKNVIIVAFPAKSGKGYATVSMHIQDDFVYVYNRGYTIDSIEEQKENVEPMMD